MISVTHEEQLGLNSPADPHAGDSRTQKCGDSILLVEDDMPTLRLERVILEEAGYLVEGVACGEAALELIADEPPALVILDNGLPGMDGFTTCRRIREVSRVPVLMISGGKTTANRKQATASGANGYITKPFSTGKLVDLAAEIIAESAGYFHEGQGEGEGSQPVDKSLSNSQLPEEDNAPAPSASVLDARDPIGESASLSAEDRNQPDGDQPIDSALSWRNEDSPARVLDPVDEEEPEDDPTEVAVVWNSQYSQEQQSPLEDPDSEDSLPWYGGEPEYPRPGHSGQDLNQPASPTTVAWDQRKTSAASSLEEQPNGPADKKEHDSAFSPSALPAEDLAENVHEDPIPADEPPEEPTAEPPEDLDAELYEGTVRLRVTSSGPVKNLLAFVGELRQNTQLRLLRLVASQRSESMDIWLGLREPLHLITILGDIPGVSRVAALPDPGEDEKERRVTVAIGQ